MGTADGRLWAAGERRAKLVEGQQPFAVVLGCSDSRVPAEIVFGQGLGDLFVIRVAGHVVTPAQIGSVEFAVQQLGVRLVVVLGHSQCGAVRATIESLLRPAEDYSKNLLSIIDQIRPSVEPLLASELREDPQALLQQAVRAHVRASAQSLLRGSQAVERSIKREGLAVVSAEYSLESGLVDFFAGLPVE